MSNTKEDLTKTKKTRILEISDDEDPDVMLEKIKQKLNLSSVKRDTSDSLENAVSSSTTQDINTAAVNEVRIRTENEVRQTLEAKLAAKKAEVHVTKPLRQAVRGFSTEVDIPVVNHIPSLFTIASQGVGETQGLDFLGKPLYLEATCEKFGFGVTEARVVLVSDGLPTEVSFRLDELGSTSIHEVVANTVNPSEASIQRETLTLRIIETMFSIYNSTQILISSVPFTYPINNPGFTGDLVSTQGMLDRKYVNQRKPVIPALGFSDKTDYLRDIIGGIFQDPVNHMHLGVTEDLGVDRMLLFRDIACVTDQWFATLYRLFIDFIEARRVNFPVLLQQLRILTFPDAKITLLDAAQYEHHYWPNWTRLDCHGSVLMYALSVDRQSQFLDHLILLLQRVNVIRVKSKEKFLSDIPSLSTIDDRKLMELLNGIVGQFQDHDIYRALAADVSTTWIDTEIEPTDSDSTVFSAIFRVFTVLLWFNIFPAIAVDCAPRLMYTLFTSLQTLIPSETRNYCERFGFCTLNGFQTPTNLPPQQAYQRGEYGFPILQGRPRGGNLPLFTRLYNLLHLPDIIRCNTRDSPDIHIPRMTDLRTYIQPWRFHPLQTPGETGFGARLLNIYDFCISLIDVYCTRTVRGIASKGTFGSDGTRAISVSDFFRYMSADDFTPRFALRIHCEMYRLRELAQNSIYAVGDTFAGVLNMRVVRPLVFGMARDGRWTSFPFTRAKTRFGFYLPFYMLLGLEGLTSFEDTVTPPSVSEEFSKLRVIQREGMIFGDVLTFTQALMFGDENRFRRDLRRTLGDYLSSTRVSIILQHLATSIKLPVGDLFTRTIRGIERHLDSRASGFRICLSVFNGFGNLPTNPIPGTLYGENLQLNRPYTEACFDHISTIFAPETTPIALFSRGLFITRVFTPTYSPDANIQLGDFLEQRPDTIIIVWATTLITTRLLERAFARSETVLTLPIDGEAVQFSSPTEQMPNVLILVTARSGAIQPRHINFLRTFFDSRKVHFLLPDLLVGRHPIQITHATTDVDLSSQFETILTKSPSSQRMVKMYDTTLSNALGTVNTTGEKWFFLAEPARNNDLVIRGAVHQTIQSPSLHLSPPTMWCYGINQARSVLRVAEDEEIGQVEVDKLALGHVNFNNVVRSFVTTSILKPPEFIIDPTPLAETVFALNYDL